MMPRLVSAFIGMGGLGLFLVTFADASYLVIPLTNDLLLIILVAHHPLRLPYYALLAACGSICGAFTLDIVFRKGGRKIERMVPRKRFEYIQGKMANRTGWALGLSALLPPPFPMKPAVIAASALQYPRKKMYAIIFVTRFLRYGAIGLIGLFFARQVVEFIKSPTVAYLMYFLIGIAVLGTTIAVVRWVKQSKEQPPDEENRNPRHTP